MNIQVVLIYASSIRELIAHLSWVIFLPFSLICLKNKKYAVLSLCLLLLFGAIFIPESDKLGVGKEGFTFTRKTISKNLQTLDVKNLNTLYLTQEYPSAQKIEYRESVDLRSRQAVMKLQSEEQPFWLGINNSGISNFVNPILFLDFGGKLKVRVDNGRSRGWIASDPNFTYFNKIQTSIQPETGLRLYPIFVTFPQEGDYTVVYAISGDNQASIKGEFKICVKKE